jgi:hypothetical protein
MGGIQLDCQKQNYIKTILKSKEFRTNINIIRTNVIIYMSTETFENVVSIGDSISNNLLDINNIIQVDSPIDNIIETDQQLQAIDQKNKGFEILATAPLDQKLNKDIVNNFNLDRRYIDGIGDNGNTVDDSGGIVVSYGDQIKNNVDQINSILTNDEKLRNITLVEEPSKYDEYNKKRIVLTRSWGVGSGRTRWTINYDATLTPSLAKDWGLNTDKIGDPAPDDSENSDNDDSGSDGDNKKTSEQIINDISIDDGLNPKAIDLLNELIDYWNRVENLNQDITATDIYRYANKKDSWRAEFFVGYCESLAKFGLEWGDLEKFELNPFPEIDFWVSVKDDIHNPIIRLIKQADQNGLFTVDNGFNHFYVDHRNNKIETGIWFEDGTEDENGKVERSDRSVNSNKEAHMDLVVRSVDMPTTPDEIKNVSENYNGTPIDDEGEYNSIVDDENNNDDNGGGDDGSSNVGSGKPTVDNSVSDEDEEKAKESERTDSDDYVTTTEDGETVVIDTETGEVTPIDDVDSHNSDDVDNGGDDNGDDNNGGDGQKAGFENKALYAAGLVGVVGVLYYYYEENN